VGSSGRGDRHVTHSQSAIAPVIWSRVPTSFFVTWLFHVRRTLHPLILPDVALPCPEDPTLTLPLPRSGDRRWFYTWKTYSC